MTAATVYPALDLAPEQLPRHIAIIMDGNGRWARVRDLPRTEGHRAGARAVRDVVEECARLGLEALTLYSFSLENWKRPLDEVQALMRLYVEYLLRERQTMLDNDVRLVQLGRREGLPPDVLGTMDETIAATSEAGGMTLALALNYGSRAEIVDAVQAIARDVRDGTLEPDAIDEGTIERHLYTAGMPDPDLLIRTAGERRISNYLLWQISYAEIHVSDVLWPEFGIPELHAALRDYAARDRRYGGLSE